MNASAGPRRYVHFLRDAMMPVTLCCDIRPIVIDRTPSRERATLHLQHNVSRREGRHYPVHRVREQLQFGQCSMH